MVKNVRALIILKLSLSSRQERQERQERQIIKSSFVFQGGASPQGETYTRDGWRDEVDVTYGDGCGGFTYARGANQWATRINPTKSCLDAVHQRNNLKPGWFEESYVYNITANNGLNADLKQNQLD